MGLKTMGMHLFAVADVTVMVVRQGASGGISTNLGSITATNILKTVCDVCDFP